MARPNILLILNDDMGFSDIGCYGGEVQTPALDRLAARGLRFTQFYNTARCCPTRASLLTGLHPHQAGVGHMTGWDDDDDGYRGTLRDETATMAEVLGQSGYRTYMSGKWHVAANSQEDGDISHWPLQRGFDEFYGLIYGAASFYQPTSLARGNKRLEIGPEDKDYFFTDAVSDECCRMLQSHADAAFEDDDTPFFCYLAYTAPHWPLHAHEEDIDKYKGRFAEGWDSLREQRLERMRDMGLLDESWGLTERDPTQPAWEDSLYKKWQQRRMEVYAAQIDRMDQGIQRVLDTLEATGQLDNTLIFFLADNGACAEEMNGNYPYDREPKFVSPSQSLIAPTHTLDGQPVQYGNDPNVMPGGPETYQSYGIAWANLSNTPFREYKHWVHEGGIATPLIVHWPEGLEAQGEIRHHLGQLPDIMATCLEASGAAWLSERDGHAVPPPEGTSLLPALRDEADPARDLVWEHEGNCALRRGKWKLVRKHLKPWELYDMETDRTETNDLAAEHPELLNDLVESWQTWANRCNVLPFEELHARRKSGRSRRVEGVG